MPSSRGRGCRRGMGEAASENPVARNLVDINVASVEELSTLVGVGRSRAEAIVETRNVRHTPTRLQAFANALLCTVARGLHLHRGPEPCPGSGQQLDRSQPSNTNRVCPAPLISGERTQSQHSQQVSDLQSVPSPHSNRSLVS